MSSSASRWRWPQPCTTARSEVQGPRRTQPHGDRRRPPRERCASRTTLQGARNHLSQESIPGEHPGVLKEPEVQGRIGQHSGIGFELVQALDVPVLQMVEQPVEVDSFFRNFVPAVAEQVIEVPMLALPGCSVQRAALSEPQTVEQLVEVPTVLSYSLLQQRTAEQIIGFPVPGRGGGARGSLQGLPQGQGSTASAGKQTIVPARGGLERLPQGQGSTASAGEQTIVPVRGGRQGLPQGQGSTASAGEQTIVSVRGSSSTVFPKDRVPAASAGEQSVHRSGGSRGGLQRFFPKDRVPLSVCR